MITEDRLSAALEQAASAFEPPANGASRIVDAASVSSPRAARRLTFPRRRLVVAVGIVAAATLVGLVTTATDFGRSARVTETAGRVESAGSGTTVGGDDLAKAERGDLAGAAASGAPNPAASAAATVGDREAQVPLPLVKIVKTGSLELEVADGRVDDAMARLQAIAAGVGGFVSDAKSDEGDGHPSGVVTVRIPAEQFDAAVTQVRRLGTVSHASSSATDVTAEYTDITARLRSLTATRQSLLDVLAGARSIGDILAVRDRITDVQTQIEQLQGRQQVLDNQVALSTLAVSVNEKGDATVAASRRSAWNRAVDGFTSTWASILAHAGGVIAVLVALAVLAVALCIGGGWVRRAYVRRRA